MKDKQLRLSQQEIAKIQAERKNRPSNIVHGLLTTLSQIEADGSRNAFTQENLARSITEIQQRERPFYMDTITCPLYQFGDSLGKFENFAAIQAVGVHLEDESRYLAKFQRYLAALQTANTFLQSLDEPISIEGRVFFGDSGVLGVDTLKRQYGVSDDQSLRENLLQQQETYETYFAKKQRQLGLENVTVTFAPISAIAPQLEKAPLDMYTVAKQSGFVNGSPTSFYLDTEKMHQAGIDAKIIETVRTTSDIYARGRQEEFGLRRSHSMYDTYLEVVGFLLSYANAGKALQEQAQPTDLFVTGDPYPNYRNDLYYGFLGKKGTDLTMFTPATDKIKEKGLF